MGWLKTLFVGPDLAQRMKPKRFAPYSLWSKMRVLGLVGLALFPLSVVLVVLLGQLWPLLLLVLAFLIWLPIPGLTDNSLLPVTPEIVGGFLASRFCPSCGQSIFDTAPASGYVSDNVREQWWPSQFCANCDHDLTKRMAA